MNGLALGLILMFLSIVIVLAGYYIAYTFDKIYAVIIAYIIGLIIDLTGIYYIIMFVLSFFIK